MEMQKLQSCSFLLSLFLVWTRTHVGDSLQNPETTEEDVKRWQFPDGFLFGVATSAYQIEGAFLEDGKGLSNWDVFVHKQGQVKNGDTGDIAADHYHRYLEDIEIIDSLGVDSYRFSISWTRIFPRGKFGSVNPAGILFYNKIIDSLLLRGIEPFVTIHHEDYPQELVDRYGGWLSPLMQDDFLLFAETCFKNFGDRVRYWVTINEPNLVSEFEYERGVYPPARCSFPFGNCSAGNSDTEPLIAAHNMLLGHAKAVRLYRQHFQPKQGGMIGIVATTLMYEPLYDDEFHRDAAARALAFNIAWAFDPVVFGDYPPEMRRLHGKELPEFTPEERQLITDSADFLGLNHYATLYTKDCLHSSCACSESDPTCVPGGDRPIRGFASTVCIRDGVSIGEPTGIARFCVVPRGLEEIVAYVKNRYHNKPMFITENGYSSVLDESLEGLRYDVKRIEYHKTYLASLARAISDGADVRGYFIWSVMDNFEWQEGYSVKFGLYSIEPLTLNRIPKSSAKWYQDFLKNSSLDGPNPRRRTTFPLKFGRGLVKNGEKIYKS